jgi:hypothetical protein
MNPELIVSVCVALCTIVIMLMFLLDLIKRSFMLIQAETMETPETNNKIDASMKTVVKAPTNSDMKVGTEVHTAPTLIPDKQLAYPFYVGYIHSKDYMPHHGDNSSLNVQPLANQQDLNSSKTG